MQVLTVSELLPAHAEIDTQIDHGADKLFGNFTDVR
jgi:hypothetical protein